MYKTTKAKLLATHGLKQYSQGGGHRKSTTRIPVGGEDDSVVVVAGEELGHAVLLRAQARPDPALAAAGLCFEFLDRHALDVPTHRDRHHRPAAARKTFTTKISTHKELREIKKQIQIKSAHENYQ